MIPYRWPLLGGLLLALVVLAASDGLLLAGFRGVGYTVCHQLPTHSFFMAGEQLPLCARCTGIYLGFLAGLAGLALLGRLSASRLPSKSVSAVLLVAIAAMAGDGFNSLFGYLPDAATLYETTNLIRLATGIAAGVAFALILVPMVNDALWAKPSGEESATDFGELLGYVIIAALVATLVYSEHPVLLYPVSALGTVGVVATLTSAGTVLAATVLRKERKAVQMRDAWSPAALGLALSLLSMAVLGAARAFFSVPVGI